MKQLLDGGASFEVPSSTLLLHAVQVGSVDLAQLVLDLFPEGAGERAAGLVDCQQALWVAATSFGTDYGYELTQLLLERTKITPWLRDERGVGLLECVWSGLYYYTPNEVYQPRCLVQENRLRIMGLLYASMIHWTPQRHALYPLEFRRAVRAFLLSTRGWFCRDIRHEIIKWMAVAASQPQFNRYRNTELTRVLQSKTTRLPRKRLKRTLVETADNMYRADVQLHSQMQREIRLNPGVVGYVEVIQFNGERIASYEVRMPWLTLGRAQLFGHPTVSRVHLMIRLHEGKQWQIRILGNNGVAVNGMRYFKPHPWMNATEFELPFAQLRCFVKPNNSTRSVELLGFTPTLQ